MPTPRRIPQVAALIVLLAAGCTGTDDGPDQVAQRPSRFTPTAPVTGIGTVSMDCAKAVGGVTAPPDGYVAVLDAVALPDSARVLPLTDAEGTSGGRRFAEAGLLLRVGATAEIGVPSDAAQRPAIAWGELPEPASVLTVPACLPRPDGADWQAFAGGFYAEHPMCVPVTVRAAGREQTLHVPVGAACP